jgi:hypothetical protein
VKPDERGIALEKMASGEEKEDSDNQLAEE